MRSENSFLGGLLCIHASFIASISLTCIALGPSEASRCDEKCFFQLSTIFYCYYVLTHASLLRGFLTLVEANSTGTGGGLAFATCVVATVAVSRLLFACVESMGTFAAAVGLVYGTAVHVLGFYLAIEKV